MSVVKKVIWFKKAKCAGTSLETMLQHYGAIYYVNPKTTLAELENPENKVICIREALFPYGKTLIKQANNTYKLEGSKLNFQLRKNLLCPFIPKDFMFRKYPGFLTKHSKFAVVRNPYDKFISSWKYLKALRDMDIEAVIKNLPGKRRLHDYIHITQLQYAVIRGPGGVPAVDKIIHMEKGFNEGIQSILDSLDIPEKTLPKENRSYRQGLHQYLSTDVSELIYRIFQKDFETFGYKKCIDDLSPYDLT